MTTKNNAYQVVCEIKKNISKKSKPKPNLKSLADQTVRDKFAVDLGKEIQRMIASPEAQVE